MNSKKWILSIAILTGLALVPAQAHAGCGKWDLVCKAGEGLKKVGDALQNFADAPANAMKSIGVPPIIANTLTYINPVNLVAKGTGMAASALGNYLSPPQETAVTQNYNCASPLSCCEPGPTTKNPPSPLVPVNQVIAKGGNVVAKGGNVVAKGGNVVNKDGEIILIVNKGGNVVDKGGNVVGKVDKDGNIVDKGGNVVGKVGGGTGDGAGTPGTIPGAAPAGTFAPLAAAPGGGFFKAPVGTGGGPANASSLGKAGFGVPSGQAMKSQSEVGIKKHVPTGAAGAQKGGGGGGFNAPEAKAGQGSASIGLNAKFAGDGSFVGGGQGVASGLGIGAGGGIQRGPSVTDAEKSVPEIPVDGQPDGQGMGADSKSGLGEGAAGTEGETPGAGEEGQPGDISRAVGLMRNQEGLSGELGTLVNSALKMIELRDWAAAIKALNKAIELSPNNPLLYVYRATAFNLSGDYASAERDARKAIELDPKSSPAHEALAWSLLRQEKYDEAIQVATKAIELDPQSAMPWAIRAYAKQMLGDLTGMLEDIKQAAALDSRFRPQYEAALKGGKIYDPSIKDELYILGPAKGRRGGGAGGAGAMGFFLLLLLGSAGAAGAILYRKRAKKAAAEGKKLNLNFLLKGGESKPLVKK